MAKKWLRTPADHEAVRRGYYFDQAAANYACDFIETFCCHTANAGDHAGQPFLLLPWQRDFVSRLYGWKRPDGTRRYREAYLEIAKKNGKSSLLGALCELGLVEEPGAGVYQGATDKDQAAIIFRSVVEMIEASPDLRPEFKINRHSSVITLPATNSRLECMSAEINKKDGINSSLTVLDEVHRFGRDRRLYDILKYAGRSRKQPLLISITTAGYDKKSLCWELHERARKIDEGSTDDLRFLGVIYAADPDDDLDDPKVWRKANPSMGHTMSEDDFREDLAEARRIPGRWNNFARLSFNIWTNAVTQWLPLDLWDACKADPPGLLDVGGKVAFDPRWWKGRTCNLGVDLSSVRDLTALTLTTLDEGVVHWHSFYFVPLETMQERADRDGVPYPDWAAEGWIFGTDGNATDFAFIRQLVNDLRDQGIVLGTVGFDPWNAAQLMMELMQDGFNVVEIRQVIGNLTAPSKELERRLLDGTLAHDGSPVTRWCVENCATRTDAQGNIMPAKDKSTERIDGVAAGVMSLGITTGTQIINPGFGLL